jgi:diacylglycerol O-acyltransferase
MASTKALSVLDMAFFMLETRERMSNVGPLAILQPPPRTRSAKAFADRLMTRMKARPVGAPFNLRYRPAGLQGLPCLETVDAVDLDVHCHRLTLPAPGTDKQLFDAVCRLHEKRLDRWRPPWVFYVIDGLERGRIALYAKVHHGLIDGRGFVEVCTRWLGTDPSDREARALWEGLPVRRTRDAGTGKAIDVAVLAARLGASARSMTSLSVAVARQALASSKLAPGMRLPFVGTPGTLRAKPSVGRSFAYCVLPLAAMKAFGKAHEASVNDVLLTVLDMALNRYLSEKGRAPGAKPLVVDMPVALAPGEGGGGNAIAVLQFPLGAVAASPRARLAQIQRRTAAVKAHVRRTDASALVTYTAAVHGVPALLETLRFQRGPMLANMMVSNPFGLAQRRYLAGAELEMALPVSLLAPGQSLNITAVTYDQGLQIAFLGMAAELPDIQRLADLALAAFDELCVPAAAPRRPAAVRPRRPRGAEATTAKPARAAQPTP